MKLLKLMFHLGDLPREDKGLDLQEKSISHDPLKVAVTPDWPRLIAHCKVLLSQASQTAFPGHHIQQTPILVKHEILMVTLVKHQDPSKKSHSYRDYLELFWPLASKLTD